MFIAATAQTRWKSPGVLAPLLKIGRYSYEVYLTHMFRRVRIVRPVSQRWQRMSLVPVLFVATTLVAGLLGGAFRVCTRSR